ncbi:hypothetical protein PSTAB_4009 [Stutzerimonas stutzeri]|uniref:Uncharacterized protein n=1 Tax=Stutzerimonas stutzeri (strain ATCC 17588 / DSM 5190 / CCUG 11256 / JCM 5965 / LMG 11199 / NBRC 14165 / NCIMB 11358 / Stanier 221) TaxID=96563 RepID=F8H5T4_STUS2|nr:hypothetical protein PSTAB_4009 [Stutzerimonas stutzeri]
MHRALLPIAHPAVMVPASDGPTGRLYRFCRAENGHEKSASIEPSLRVILDGASVDRPVGPVRSACLLAWRLMP